MIFNHGAMLAFRLRIRKRATIDLSREKTWDYLKKPWARYIISLELRMRLKKEGAKSWG